MGMTSAKFHLELGLQAGRLRLLPASSAVEGDATTDQAAGVAEPFPWQRNPCSEQGGGSRPKAVLGGRR